jgi:hypothetical protein
VFKNERGKLMYATGLANAFMNQEITKIMKANDYSKAMAKTSKDVESVESMKLFLDGLTCSSGDSFENHILE